MSKNQQKPGPVRGGGNAPEPPRSSIVFPVIAFAVLLVAGIICYQIFNKPAQPPPADPAPPAPVVHVPMVTPPTRPPAEPVDATPPPPPTHVATIPAAPPDPATARQLLANVMDIDVRNPIALGQAQAWRDALQQLVRQGATAIPIIKDYLAQNLETNFAGVPGGDQLGYPSLRAGLLDALAQIGTPDATAALLQILQSSTYPTDIAQAAKSLGSAATGQYQQEMMAAIRQQLFLASQPQMGPPPDVGPLFQVLMAEAAGGAQVAQEIQPYGTKWPFYSTMTLANLPDGGGVPTLVQMAQTTDVSQAAALDALAGMSANNQKALDALLDMAKSGQIPDNILKTAAPFLAGQQYLLPANAGNVPPGTMTQNIHMAGGNQNFIGVTYLPPQQINQQLTTIDQLLQAIPPADTDTLQELQRQRAILAARAGK